MGFMQINGVQYNIPQELDLLTALDEISGTYRISLGIVDATPEQKQQLEPLYKEIDRLTHGMFLDTPLLFGQDTQRLSMTIATVDKYTRAFGTFYDIEANIKDTKIFTELKEGRKKRDSSRSTSTRKNKATNGISNITS